MLTLAFKAGQSVPFEVRWDTHEDVMPPDMSRVQAQPMGVFNHQTNQRSSG